MVCSFPPRELIVLTFAVSIANSFNSPVFIEPVGPGFNELSASPLQEPIDKSSTAKEIVKKVLIFFMILIFYKAKMLLFSSENNTLKFVF